MNTPSKLLLVMLMAGGVFCFATACGRHHSDGIISPVPSPTGQGGEFGSAADSGGKENPEPDLGGIGIDNGFDAIGFADSVTGGAENDGDTISPDPDSTGDAGAVGDDMGVDDTADPDDGAGADIDQDGGCQPKCAGQKCGDDGCGGECGQCDSGSSCIAGQCVTDISYCAQGCVTAADCASPASPAAYDANHFKCIDGACKYLGCQNHVECTELYAGLPALCDDANPVLPLCAMACTIPADCVLDGGGGAYDADNYQCDAGVCRYAGCHTDKECQSSFSDGSAGCDLSLKLPICKPTCVTNKDCGQTHTAYDADNYTCVDGLCTYIGCHNDDECTALGAGPWVCSDY